MKRFLLVLFVLLPALAFADYVPAVHKSGKWGFKESKYSDKFIIKPKFEKVNKFTGQYAFVRQKGLWGIIGKDGKFAIKPKYVSASEPYSGITIVELNGKFGLAKGTTELTAICYDRIKYSTRGSYFYAQSNGKYGLLDGQSGKMLCDAKYDAIIKFDYETFLVKLNDKYGLLDKQGQSLTKVEYDEIKAFEDSYFLVTSNGKYGLLIKQGQSLTKVEYDEIKAFEDNNFLVKLNGKCGVLDKNCKTCLEIKYENVTYVLNDTFLIVDDGKLKFADAKGGNVDIPGNVIIYTTTDGCKIDGNFSGLCSHTYENGVGKLVFNSEVTSIRFTNCRSLTSITIPNSVTSIESSAFYGCSSLTSITIPNSVTSIGNNAFSYCESLTSITIPNSVTSIGKYAFSGCYRLTRVNVNISDLARYCTSNPMHRIPGEKHLYLNGKEITNLVIPNSVTSIGYEAFEDCDSLTSITIPNSVTSIGKYAFSGCCCLTRVNVNISDLARYCTSNPMHRIPGEKHLYLNGKEITNLVIPNSVTSIGVNAFASCSSLTSATIGNGVTSIGDWAFDGCTGLTSITIPNGVTSIGKEAFYGCNRLTSVTIGNSVTSIGYKAFYGCVSLKAVYINATIPPYLDKEVFDYYGSRICCPIYVPNSSLGKYKGVGGNWEHYSQYLRGR